MTIRLPQQRFDTSAFMQCLQENMAARIRTARSEAARMVEFDYGEAGGILPSLFIMLMVVLLQLGR